MKFFTTNQIKEIDANTIRSEPVSPADLMERAAMALTIWFADRFSRMQSVAVFAGPGNNGGDGWAMARLLADKGFSHIRLYHLNHNQPVSTEAEEKRNRLISQAKVITQAIGSSDDFPHLIGNEIIIDALFGSGLSRPPEGLALQVIRQINQSGCKVISIDIPSGMMGEDNSQTDQGSVVHAAHTLCFEFPRLAFFFSENEKFTGEWHVLPIGLHRQSIDTTSTPYYFTTLSDAAPMLKKRRRFTHKGNYGHAMLIAGSTGMAGAAILAAKSCLRMGAGLVTCHLPSVCYPMVQTAVPEAMFSIDSSENTVSEVPLSDHFSAWGAGPGLGTNATTADAIFKWLSLCRKPVVLDADALNILAGKGDLYGHLPEGSVLTPHPGEFDRLAGKCNGGYARFCRQVEFARTYKVTIVLKGAYSSIVLPDGSAWFNSTGNPGMATAGSGDVLTGMLLSLLSQGYDPGPAAILSAYVHGYAGDLASARLGQHAVTASDIIKYIGPSVLELENWNNENIG